MSAPFQWFVAIVLVVVAAPGGAMAGTLRSVHIESDPPGADVYLGDRTTGSRGKTPLDVELAVGTYTVILELEGHQPASQPFVVDAARGKKATALVNLKVVLTPSLSVLEVVGSAPAGARVVIDGRDRGPLPVRVEVEPGAHHVQVTRDGAAPYDEQVRVESGDERQVKVDFTSESPAPAAVSRGPRAPVAILRVGTKAIWRRFSYDGAENPVTTGEFASDGKLMVRAEAEVAPWRTMARAHRFWPLTLVLGAGITGTDTATRIDESANFNQREIEAGLRYRLGLGAHLAIAFDAGWAALLYNFSGDLAYALPDVDYQVMRLGVRGESRVGSLTGWVGVENRLVAGAGDLGGRFKTASADGFAARAGLLKRFGGDRFEVGVEYSLVRFGWSFEPKDTAPMYIADGATDTFHNLGVWFGGGY